MTHPDDADSGHLTEPDEDTRGGAGDAGALAAASEHDDPSGDPLGPLTRLTEGDSADPH
jgi:hypothetical protein